MNFIESFESQLLFCNNSSLYKVNHSLILRQSPYILITHIQAKKKSRYLSKLPGLTSTLLKIVGQLGLTSPRTILSATSSKATMANPFHQTCFIFL